MTNRPRFPLSDGPIPGVRIFLVPVLLAGLSACGGGAPEAAAPPSPPGEASTRAVQPGAPGSASRALTPAQLSTARLAHTEADVRFMQDMIHHHVQAIQMSRLVPDRTENPSLRLLSARIDRSQDDEIALMVRWLEQRGAEVPDFAAALAESETRMDHAGHGHQPPPPADDPHAGHAGHTGHGAEGHEMPGMLTPEQMARLAAAEGETFDRLFLEAMIFHHEGAIDMVETLFATRGAAQDSEIFQFASHVGSDQQIEIARMERMLQDDG